MKSISYYYVSLALMVVLPKGTQAESTPKTAVIDAASLVSVVLNELPNVGNQKVCVEFDPTDKAKKISKELTIKRTLSPFMETCLKSIPNQNFRKLLKMLSVWALN
jgi:hypothetical protein